MRIVAQRSLEASCEVDGKITGKIKNGLVLLVGFTQTDTKEIVDYMVRKVLNLRIFDDENGIMNKSIDKENVQILSISQFTLYGDPITTSGRDVLRYNYFLINTNDLLTLEKTEHIFDQYVFSEVLK